MYEIFLQLIIFPQGDFVHLKLRILIIRKIIERKLLVFSRAFRVVVCFLRSYHNYLSTFVYEYQTLLLGLTGDKFKFNSKGDGPARYNIIHYKQVEKGVYKWVNVGFFHDEAIELNMTGKYQRARGRCFNPRITK